MQHAYMHEKYSTLPSTNQTQTLVVIPKTIVMNRTLRCDLVVLADSSIVS